ncbi:MAG TPA: hypothetical protein PKA05_14265 [Roseiflexaceae bacterium]|nr:hypothetical protein [Roseiflexaceae bacterium]HMP41540.1 hypothetical protein [Roseiflexaceae bacterium]
MQTMIAPDETIFNLPTRDEALAAAYRQLALLFRPDELVWIAAETFDTALVWRIDVVRQGAGGRWVRQRYRYDGQAEVIYYIGERSLSDDEFRSARSAGRPFERPA